MAHNPYNNYNMNGGANHQPPRGNGNNYGQQGNFPYQATAPYFGGPPMPHDQMTVSGSDPSHVQGQLSYAHQQQQQAGYGAMPMHQQGLMAMHPGYMQQPQLTYGGVHHQGWNGMDAGNTGSVAGASLPRPHQLPVGHPGGGSDTNIQRPQQGPPPVVEFSSGGSSTSSHSLSTVTTTRPADNSNSNTNADYKRFFTQGGIILKFKKAPKELKKFAKTAWRVRAEKEDVHENEGELEKGLVTWRQELGDGKESIQQEENADEESRGLLRAKLVDGNAAIKDEFDKKIKKLEQEIKQMEKQKVAALKKNQDDFDKALKDLDSKKSSRMQAMNYVLTDEVSLEIISFFGTVDKEWKGPIPSRWLPATTLLLVLLEKKVPQRFRWGMLDFASFVGYPTYQEMANAPKLHKLYGLKLLSHLIFQSNDMKNKYTAYQSDLKLLRDAGVVHSKFNGPQYNQQFNKEVVDAAFLACFGGYLLDGSSNKGNILLKPGNSYYPFQPFDERDQNNMEGKPMRDRIREAASSERHKRMLAYIDENGQYDVDFAKLPVESDDDSNSMWMSDSENEDS